MILDEESAIHIPRDLLVALRPAAMRRDCSVQRLIVEVVIADGLVDAVLNDGGHARPKRRAGRRVASSIITVATMKGGSGKSTVASCLAVHWHLPGRRPTIIDADLQRSIARMATETFLIAGDELKSRATWLTVSFAGF